MSETQADLTNHGADSTGLGLEELEEQIHFANVISTFRSYASYSLAANNRRRKDYHTLPLPDQQLLDAVGYRQRLADVDQAILVNAALLGQIVEDPGIWGHEMEGGKGEDEEMGDRRHVGSDEVEGIDGEVVSMDATKPDENGHEEVVGQSLNICSHSHPHAHSHSHVHKPRKQRYRPTDFDMDKLRSTIKQFVRDWSAEGGEERETNYKPMRDALLAHFSDIPAEERANFRVLVPGAGLGRLAYDVASLGFTCQGNEFSHYMLLASYFVLNRTTAIGQHTIYPFVHSLSNVPDRHAMLRPISIPDVLPSALPPGSNFSLVAGDFEEIYGAGDDGEHEHEPQAGEWDAILTCFFIDTAKNIVNYLRIIHSILAPGGVWINLGPLLWHWENNNTNDPSIELDLEDVKALARKIGFEISNERTIDTTYTSNRESMLGYVYRAAFWTATKIV